MKSNPFNICPTCVNRDTCVLTDQKSQVWSCSEYEEEITATKLESEPKITSEKQQEPVMAMS